MAKAKSESLTLKQRLYRLEQRFPNGGGLDVDQLSVFNTKQQNRIAALEEAICPRVAARLTALERGFDDVQERAHERTERICTLERHIELQKGENQAVFQRLNTDDADKKRVFEVLTAIRTTVLARMQTTEQDISEINKSVAILSAVVKRGVMVEDTPELRSAFGVSGEAKHAEPAPTQRSKADSSNAVTNLINRIKDEMGLEFSPQGMARIIRWVEQA